MCGRINIEPDDVAQFVDEARVVGQLELADAMRLEPVRAPDALDRGDADPGRLRHHRAGPMGRLAGRSPMRQRDDTFGGLGSSA